VTALARHTLRAAAMLGQTPTAMLGTLHRALRGQAAGADLCTVSVVTLRRAEPGQAAELTVALAGHPPPLIIERSGRASHVGRPGTLLGVIDPIDISEVHTQLYPQQTLLLYTDGLPEAGRPHRQLGERGLQALCAQAPSLDLAALLAHIEQTALGHAQGMLRDDIALLAVRLC
jgi:serine phosphatase RsbU (regulator of sigma subunit)